MVAHYQGVGDQGGVNQKRLNRPLSCNSRTRILAPELMAGSGQNPPPPFVTGMPAPALIADTAAHCGRGKALGSGYGGPNPPTAPLIERASKSPRCNRSVTLGLSPPMAPPG